MNKNMQFTVRVPEDQAAYLREVAGKIDVPYSQLIRYAIKTHVFCAPRLDKNALSLIEEKGAGRRAAIVVRMTEKDGEALGAICEGVPMSRSTVVRYALRRYLDDIR